MNIGVCISFQIIIFIFFKYLEFLQINSEVELLYHMVVLFKKFFEVSPYCFSQCLHQFTVLPIVHKGSFFSKSLPTLVISCPFDSSHSHRCEVTSHCGSALHLLVISEPDHLSCACACQPPVCFLWKNVCSGPCPFLKCITPFCCCCCYRAMCVLSVFVY